MTSVIARPRVDVMGKPCVDECPAGCICGGGPMLCIHPASYGTGR